MSTCCPSSSPITPLNVITDRSHWNAAREELLKKEKEYTRLRDQLTVARNSLPLYQLSPSEVSSLKFCSESSASESIGIIQLFKQSNTNKLLIYNCMSFEKYPCGACTVVIKQLNSIHTYLQKYAHTAVVSRAPIDRLQYVKNVQGWSLPVYSCNLAFTRLVGTETTDDESIYKSISGMASLCYDVSSGAVYLYYNSLNRGVEDLECYFNWFDRIPFNDRKLRTHPVYPWKNHDNDAVDTKTNGADVKSDCCAGKENGSNGTGSLDPFKSLHFSRTRSAFSYTIVPTLNMKQSITFYESLFGFIPRANESMDEWTVLDTGSTGLALHLMPADTNGNKKRKTPASPVAGADSTAASDHTLELSFFVPNSDEFHKKALSLNVTVIEPPTAQPWGGVKAAYRDCHGYRMSVVQMCGTS